MAEYFKELRRRVGKEMILIPGTGAIVLNDRDEVLLMLRTDDRTWGLPGGFMDLGETVRESLRRELREELDIESRDELLFAVYSGPEFELTHDNGDRTSSVTIVFIVRHFTGTPRTSDESRATRFVDLEHLPTPMNQSTSRFLRDFGAARNGDITIPHII